MDTISLSELRAKEAHRWGPYPWNEADASPPHVDVPQDALLALIDIAEAARDWESFTPATAQAASDVHGRLTAALARVRP